MTTPDPKARLCAWFAGPKAENGEWFADTIRRIVQDYHSWRRNYFPEDGVVVDSALRRQNEPFFDAFEDRLIELLARLKNDVPFQSPRYAAHMLAEQTLPAIAGYFAAMLYNPNNVTADVASVTVRLELEASRLIARMLGYGPDCWAHLTGGGTVANIEALWAARSAKYLPFVVRDIRRALGLPAPPWPDDPAAQLGLPPGEALAGLAACFADAAAAMGAGPETARRVIDAYRASPRNVGERGLPAVCAALGSSPAVVAAETHHYCWEKALDALGLGRDAFVRVGVDADFRMDPADLGRQLDRLAAQGRHALAVVAAVGTTEEGAVDPVDRVLALRSERERRGLGSFWLHVDAAYGGYLRTLTVPSRLGLGEPRTSVKVAGRVREIDLALPEHSACEALERLGEADSITVDPHKLGYVPYPAGAVCFRSDLVKPVLRQDAPYLADPAGDAATERAARGVGMYILEGSKPGAAAAAVWLTHTLIPLDTSGHGLLMQETIRNACELHALLEGYAALAGPCPARAVCPCPPGSNIVCYAFRPAGRAASLREINEANRRVYHRFTLDPGERVYEQSFFVSRTTLSPARYSAATVRGFLLRLGVSEEEYQREGVFLLRSVLMNPWYAQAKARGRYFLSELAGELHAAAAEEFAAAGPGAPRPRTPSNLGGGGAGAGEGSGKAGEGT